MQEINEKKNTKILKIRKNWCFSKYFTQRSMFFKDFFHTLGRFFEKILRISIDFMQFFTNFHQLFIQFSMIFNILNNRKNNLDPHGFRAS